MTAARCPRCDRPKLWTCPEGSANDCRCAELFPDHCLKGEDCDANAIDWRARCLAAEAERNEAVNDRRLYYSQRLYLREAQDIARRALVEGLAECERLRVLNGDIIAALAIWVGPGDDLPTVIRRERKLAEQAIRSGAAREERERVVAWLKEAVRYVEQQLDVAMCKTCGSAIHAYEYKADAIRRAVLAISDNAHAPGKGGEV